MNFSNLFDLLKYIIFSKEETFEGKAVEQSKADKKAIFFNNLNNGLEKIADKNIQRNFLMDIPQDVKQKIQDSLDLNGTRVARAMDEGDQDIEIQDLKSYFFNSQQNYSSGMASWFMAQSFIGYQMCSILAQHWMIDKACTLPAEDAVRQGYEITVNDGVNVDIKVLEKIKELDEKFKLHENAVEFARKCHIFGVRIMLFKVKTNDPVNYYYNPFNIDGVTPFSYGGLVQVDPQWITPELGFDSVADPSSQYFLEPTWWRINNIRYHRSHLIIIRNGGKVPDILKPTYFYGGVPLPQKIYERVYSAERIANEAPQLVVTKRSQIYKTDLDEVVANQKNFEARAQFMNQMQDNYSTKVIDHNDEVFFLDTNLSGFDELMMSQYQIVAAQANIIATKLLGTSPKGFNATGEFEEKNYHEHLESIQTHKLTPMIQRHHEILIKSHILPIFKIESFKTQINWNPLDSTTTKGKAENNKLKSETDAFLVSIGAVSPEEVRQRVINDKDSGYNGIEDYTNSDYDNNSEKDIFAGETLGELEHATQKPMSMLSQSGELNKEKSDNHLGGDASTIQKESLNGAQITSLVELINNVSAGILPIETAKYIILEGFPSIPESSVNKMLEPLKINKKENNILNEEQQK